MAPLFQVFDMPTSLAFYRDLLGFEVVQDSGQGDNSGWVMLRLNGIYLMLNTQFEDEYRPATADPARTAAHDDTCLYFSSADVNAVYRYLKDLGVEINEPNNAPYGMRQLYLHDPDGFNLCFQQPVG
jgi:catechol 2,3-dioxygenase-like lactoylglutathione lyase family enzyme